jgi:hypothetical protein
MKDRSAATAALCAGLVPLVGTEVRAEVLSQGSCVVRLFGRFNGSCEIGKLSNRRLTLDIEHQLLTIELTEVRAIRPLAMTWVGCGAPSGLYVRLGDGLSIEIEHDPTAIGDEL